MQDIDFTQCEFIKENMNYLTYFYFCNSCHTIKCLYNTLDKNAKRFYKWYVYANIHMDLSFKNIIWDFLNVDDPEAYVTLIEQKRFYKII